MMSRIVREVVRLLFPLALIFGFYIVLHGHLTPGGGFQGGAVMGSAMAMLMVAYGIARFQKDFFNVPNFIGVFSLLIILYFSAHFIHPFFMDISSVPFGPNTGELFTGGVIPVMSLAVGLEVFCGVTLLLILMRRGGE